MTAEEIKLVFDNEIQKNVDFAQDIMNKQQKTILAYNEYKINNDTVKLQLGSGNNFISGWFNTDIAPCYEHNIYHLDAKRPFPFSDGTAKYIYCEHNIEHFTLLEAINILKECHRVLADGGKIRIATPDLRKLITFYLEDSGLHDKYMVWQTIQCIPALADLGFNSKALVLNNFFRHWGHQTIYDFDSLKDLLYSCGFTNVTSHKTGESCEEELRNLERHGDHITKEFNDLETMVLEASK
jgi:predicted SAM-dependent methyltransferase